METVLITGGTGMIGKALTQALIERGYAVIILTRDATKKKSDGNISYAEWDVEKQTKDIDAIKNVHFVNSFFSTSHRGLARGYAMVSI